MALAGASSGSIAASIQAALSQFNAGRMLDAEALCRKVLATAPRQPQALQLLAAIASQRGDRDAAVGYFREAVAAAPKAVQPRSNLGAALLGQGRIKEAITTLRGAIKIDPKFGLAHANLGDALLQADEWREAALVLKRAIALQPGDVKSMVNLGAALLRLDRLEEAIEPLQRAIELNPQNATAHDNLGTAYHRLGRPADAMRCHERALELNPNFDNARCHRAGLLLAEGKFAEGWRDYLARPSASDTPGPVLRELLERDLSGKSILLGRDQGLGDELFFLRFAPELKRRGARLTYKGGAKILSLLRRLPFLDHVNSEGLSPADYDLTISIGDLPYLLGVASSADLPPSVTLPILPDCLAAQSAMLRGLGPAPYIGVTWRAGAGNRDSLAKALPLERLGALVRTLPGTLVVLQRAPEKGEVSRFAKAAGRTVHDLSGLNERFEDMLALLSLLDEYVGVSNTNVHLRAAAGKGSRVLIPFPPEFRWMATGRVSPWFLDSRTYRQEAGGSWDLALEELATDLEAATAAGRAGEVAGEAALLGGIA